MRTECPEKHRISCAVGGVYTALAIERLLPVLHCGPGCLTSSRGPLASINGAQSSWTYPENVVPCTNFGEAEVVFGGTERLKTVVGSALKTYRADAVIVLPGCTSALVGDDIGEVVRSFEGSPVPVLTADTTGFKGNNLWGHSQVLRALADRFLEPAREVSPLQVNILGIVPYYDSFWEGTLEGIETLLRRIGLQPNIFYGRGRSLDDFRKIPAAAANLVIGPWVDLEFAEDLKDRFGTPVLHFSHLPIGPTETAKFVRFLVSFFELDQPAVDGYLTSEDEHYYYFIQRALAYTYGCKVLPKEFIINASASAALAMTKYLVNDLGLIPHKIYIPEDVPDRYQEAVHGYFQDLEWDHEVEVVFTNDGGFAETEIRAENFINKPMIFGSLFEEAMAIDLQMNFVPISAPLGNFLVFDKSYLGYRGALDLYSDVYSQVLAVGD